MRMVAPGGVVCTVKCASAAAGVTGGLCLTTKNASNNIAATAAAMSPLRSCDEFLDEVGVFAGDTCGALIWGGGAADAGGGDGAAAAFGGADALIFAGDGSGSASIVAGE